MAGSACAIDLRRRRGATRGALAWDLQTVREGTAAVMQRAQFEKRGLATGVKREPQDDG